MKELTIKEKAARYDEALEKAIFYKENADGVGAKDVSELIEGIFSELKESEDERIRKEIVETLKYASEIGGILNDVKCREYIAWLEKQGKIVEYYEDKLDRCAWSEPHIDMKEYTRTDAFIEKATSYIQQHWIWNTKIIADFKQYMKGE